MTGSPPRVDPQDRPTAGVRATVLVVDDHPVVRRGVRELLAHFCDMDVCAEAATVDDALREFTRTGPDLVLVDLNLSGQGSGLDLIRDLRGLDAQVPILVWTMQSLTGFAARSLRAGANGFLDKSQAPTEMAIAVKAVMSGDVYLSADMRNNLLRGMSGGGRKSSLPEDALSNRELEVFSLIGEAKGSREIAAALGVSVKTIETHRANIKHKLDLRSGTELAQRAILWISQGV
jgi:DNA-binding NarL/FixJ family response regulator